MKQQCLWANDYIEVKKGFVSNKVEACFVLVLFSVFSGKNEK